MKLFNASREEHKKMEFCEQSSRARRQAEQHLQFLSFILAHGYKSQTGAFPTTREEIR